MNSAPIALRLASGSLTPASRARKRCLGVDRDERHLVVVAERRDDLLALVAAHQPVVDEHARQLVADRAVHEQGGHRGVHAAREPTDDPALADLRADPRDLLVDDRRRAPGALTAADRLQERGQDLLPVRRVDDLGVELDPVDPARDVLDRGDRRLARARQRREAGRRLEDRVAVRHPAALLGRECRPAGARRRRDGQLGAPELADLRALTLPPSVSTSACIP